MPQEDLVAARYRGSALGRHRDYAASSLVNKAITLAQLGRGPEAIATCEDVLATFGQDPEPAVEEQVTKAANIRSYLLEQAATPPVPADTPAGAPDATGS